MIARRALLVLASLGWLAFAATPGLANDAEVFVEQTANEVVAILSDPERDFQARYTDLVALLEGSTDLETVSRLVIGKDWRTLDESQREEFQQSYRSYLLDMLAERLQVYEYSGETIEVLGTRESGKRDKVVSTKIIAANGQPFRVDWRVRERDEDNLVIDVAIEGVSLVLSQRSEFSSVMQRDGFDALLEQLRTKS
ncbi:MAG: phospholipid-binding protein MlaC [Geminicoccaceae bacterium]